MSADSKASREPYSTAHLQQMARELMSLNSEEQRQLHDIIGKNQRLNAAAPNPPYDKPDQLTMNQAEPLGKSVLYSNRIFQRPGHSIGWAVKQLWNGNRVTRVGWNGPGQRLGLQVPDANSANTLPYVYIITVQGQRVPWLASQTDLLATDWILA